MNLKRPIRRVVTSQRITRHLSAGSASGRTSCDTRNAFLTLHRAVHPRSIVWLIF